MKTNTHNFRFSLLVLAFLFAGFYSCSDGPGKKIENDYFSVTIPSNWKISNTLDNYYENGDLYFQNESGGYGKNAGLYFNVFLVDLNPGFSDMNMEDRIITETNDYMTRCLNPMGMKEFEYTSGEELNAYYTPLTFKNKTAVEKYYIAIESPFDENEGPRSSYRKGRIISFQCKEKWMIIQYQDFEKHWDENHPIFEKILESFTPKCE
ncbi:MAG: hypothetical protein MH137_05365 [Flavobacteriales bacterium]|nr:hypothetical protein [Flavobacteriales bacterium]